MSSKIERAIASDCQSMAREIISPTPKAESRIKKDNQNLALEKVYKFKTSIWNRILSANEFEHFNENEYFRWMEIYKDAKSDLSDVNPVSIEQKMALIEVINGRLIPTAIFARNNLSADVQKLNIIKLRKLQSHMKNFDLSSKLTRDDLESFAADLMLILKGPPVSLLDYFTANKTARMNQRLMRTLQEDMLLMGLKGMIDRIPEKNTYTHFERGKYIVHKFFQHNIWKYLVVPYDLPWFDRVKIPDELLEKILIDGLDAHDHELIAHLKKQNMIDHYERFRKVYKPIAFSVGFYFYYDKFNTKTDGKIGAADEEEKEKFLEEFKNLADTIMGTEDVVIKTEERLKQEQFERVLLAFKLKYNEEPTADELAEMRRRIFGKE